MGVEVGASDGEWGGTEHGTLLGPLVGARLGMEDGRALGIADGAEVGATDGDMLVLGALLGAGLLLGTVIGRSVGHDSLVGVVAKSLGNGRWTAQLNGHFRRRHTSTTTCLADSPDAEGSTTKERVVSSASKTLGATMSTTIIKPISTSSTTSDINSKTRAPPTSLAFRVCFHLFVAQHGHYRYPQRDREFHIPLH